MKKILVLLGCSVLAGCAAQAPGVWPWETSVNKKLLCKDGCTPIEARNAFIEASIFCRSVYATYESSERRGSGFKQFLGISGSLAGAVLGPISSGNTATALSGYSGATNAMQSQITEALGAAVNLQKQKAVETAINSETNKYLEADTPEKKALIAVNMANRCWTAGATAEVKALSSVINSSPP